MRNALFIVVAHLNGGAFIRKCVVNYDLFAAVCEVIV